MSWIGDMVYNSLGLNNPPPKPNPPDKMVEAPPPLVHLMIGFLFLVIGPVILWIIIELYKLQLMGFIS